MGWGDLSHSEWQTRKLIVEAQLAAKEVHQEVVRLILPHGDFLKRTKNLVSKRLVNAQLVNIECG